MRLLCFGASYGSLLGLKVALAGHQIDLICLPHEVEAFNEGGALVRMPIKGHESMVEVSSRHTKGRLNAIHPFEVNAARYDLVVLAMQEPQYRHPEVQAALMKIATAGLPCMSIMNMPPLCFIRRILGSLADEASPAYVNGRLWEAFDPTKITLCSPDAQAFRPPGEPINTLQVRLATNFKAACFEEDNDTKLLERLAQDIDAYRHEVNGEMIDLPVKLRVHRSVFVPLAKWPMLMAGNYRCILDQSVRSIKDTVYDDFEETSRIYDWVYKLCISIGASPCDLVPFPKYAAAANSLVTPSSAARALASGATAIERVDLLVQLLAQKIGQPNPLVDQIVNRVNRWLQANQQQA